MNLYWILGISSTILFIIAICIFFAYIDPICDWWEYKMAIRKKRKAARRRRLML